MLQSQKGKRARLNSTRQLAGSVSRNSLDSDNDDQMWIKACLKSTADSQSGLAVGPLQPPGKK